MKALKVAILAVMLMTSIVIIPAHILTVEVSAAKEKVEEKEGKETKKTETVVRKYQMDGSEQQQAYDQVFKIGSDEIEAFSTNGGNYSGSPIDKAFDGNRKTHWETGRQNTNDFTNEIVVQFKESVSLNRVVYAARSDAGGKGFAEEFEILASEKESGNDFKVISTGKYSGSLTDMIEIEFPETKMKRLKFVFKKANQSWASAAELRFYKKDAVSDQVNQLFTDQSYNKVSEEFKSLKALNDLEAKVKGHPFEKQYQVWIEDAKRLLENDFTATKEARTSIFDYFEHQSYTDKFKMSNDNVKSIRNNGGNYGGQVIKNAIDGNPDRKSVV